MIPNTYNNYLKIKHIIKINLLITKLLFGMYTKLPNGQIVYEEDYSCIIEPKAGKGGIFIGNL